MDKMLYSNGYGAFSESGKEYIMNVSNNKRTPVPWSHILTNGRIGTTVTSNGGGSSWYINSRENKLTTWCNDVVLDKASEIICIKQDEKILSPFPILNDETEYEITYGFGYTVFKSKVGELTTFVCNELDEKVSILNFKNNKKEKVKLEFIYGIEPVLGVDREYTKKHITCKYENSKIKMYNTYNEDYALKETYIKVIIEKENKKINFNKHKNVENVDTAEFEFINCEIELEPQEEIKIVFCLGVTNKNKEFEKVTEYENELENVKEKWKNNVEKIQVNTPNKALNIMLNGWLIYQVLTSRILGRASFYQSGGAFGFRDQLQDCLAILYINPELVRKQILYHSEHQFVEGDVLHWWHPEKDNGIRTRYSDDLLWLVYLTCEYIKITNDYNILDEKTNYIVGKILEENENECYMQTQKSDVKETLYEHCKKAIDRTLKYGKHSIPLIGSGDWNDGMNEIHGESVWLGFFLYDILKKFILLCEYKNDIDTKKKYRLELEKIKEGIDKSGWDGKWYKRAYFEDGTELGTENNDECKIDSIVQSWSVISGAR